MDIKKKTSFTFKLTAQQQNELYSILSTGNYVPREVPYTKIAVSSQLWNCNINLYTSGKCLIQGSGAEEFVINIMEPSILKQIVVGYEDELIPEQVSQEQLSPHIEPLAISTSAILSLRATTLPYAFSINLL